MPDQLDPILLLGHHQDDTTNKDNTDKPRLPVETRGPELQIREPYPYWAEPRNKFIKEAWPEAPAWFLRSACNENKGFKWQEGEDGSRFLGPIQTWPYPWAPGVMEEADPVKVRQLEGLFARMGAKSALREWLVSVFPEHHTYVEPFTGSMKVLLWKKKRSRIEIVNDADKYLINFWRYVQFYPEELAAEINSHPTSEYLFRHWHANIDSMSKFMQAVAFYYMARMSFNGIIKPTGQAYASSPHATPNPSVKVQDLLDHQQRLSGVDLRDRTFDLIIKVCNKPVSGGVFFYLDPPYWKTYFYGTPKEKLEFGWDEHVKLAELCKEIDSTGNKFIQTNSCEDDLKALYKDFHIYEREVYYSVSGTVEKRKETKEIIVSNFPLIEKKNQTSMF